MPDPALLLGLAVGLVLGGLLTLLFTRGRSARRETELAVVQEKLARFADLESRLEGERRAVAEWSQKHAALEARVAEERKAAGQQLALLEDARVKLSDAFTALSSEALRANNQSFLDLAKTKLAEFQETAKGDLEKRQQAIGELVKPVRDSLEKVDAKILEIEKARAGAYTSLTDQVNSLLNSQKELRNETGNLVRALRAPSVRGRWGEVQLRRVVELAGMTEYCDFAEQVSTTAEEQRFRPDLMVKLPGGKSIVVDAKAVLSAYLDALEAPDEAARLALVQRHARQIRDRVEELGRKAYWEQFQPAPEFVVLFLPGEMFFSAALEQDGGLIEFAADRKVVLATPTTLIALLKAIFYGWRQQHLAKNAQEISELGRELYKRLAVMGGHLSRVGKNLNQAVVAYNDTISSVESRVLVTARKLKDLQAAPEGLELDALAPVEQITRQLSAPELLNGEPESQPTSSE
jgi:DNA recombination protein RmuC